MKNDALNNTMLLITAFIWGSAFVAQKSGMDFLEPVSYNCIRSFLGALSLLVLIIIFKIKKGPNLNMNKWEERRYLFRAGIITGLVLFFAMTVQQIAMVQTSASKAGFISSMYIILVPLIAVFFGRKFSKTLWFGVFLSLVGLYFLCCADGFGAMGLGDFLVLVSALLFAIHILIIDHYAPRVDGVKLSCIQFFVVGFVSVAPALIFETPTLDNITACAVPLLYAGVFSSGIAYTLQIIAQKNTDPALASLILSFESVFSVLSAVLILNETLSQKEILGCLLMFIAVLIAQIRCGKDDTACLPKADR